MNSSDIRNRLGRTQLTGTRLADSCPEKKQHICQPQKFRHASSLCNNVQNPTWGNADTSYGRLQPASYSDGMNDKLKPKCCAIKVVFSQNDLITGVSQIRLSASGKPLPSPVKIAETIHTPKKVGNGYLTTLSGIWAEFVQNDISHPISYLGM